MVAPLSSGALWFVFVVSWFFLVLFCGFLSLRSFRFFGVSCFLVFLVLVGSFGFSALWLLSVFLGLFVFWSVFCFFLVFFFGFVCGFLSFLWFWFSGVSWFLVFLVLVGSSGFSVCLRVSLVSSFSGLLRLLLVLGAFGSFWALSVFVVLLRCVSVWGVRFARMAARGRTLGESGRTLGGSR